MAGTIGKIRIISGEVVSATKKRKMISSFLKKAGFSHLGKGAWLGFRGSDIVSGLLIEGSITDIYISSFILPIFDKIEFVNWSLGTRLVHCSPNRSAENEYKNAIDLYLENLLPVKTAQDLIVYIDKNKIDGFYTIWARFLCLLRISLIDRAEYYLDDRKRRELHESLLDQLYQIDTAIAKHDNKEIFFLLDKWEKKSREIFGHGKFQIAV